MAKAHAASTHEAEQPAQSGERFADSFALYATIVMGTFVIAITFAIIGLSQPSWLGFS